MTASPSITTLSTRRPAIASRIAGKRAVRSLPKRDQRRTRSPSLRATMRKPSNLISCSHSGPLGACTARVGSAGMRKPAGRRWRLAPEMFRHSMAAMWAPQRRVQALPCKGATSASSSQGPFGAPGTGLSRRRTGRTGRKLIGSELDCAQMDSECGRSRFAPCYVQVDGSKPSFVVTVERTVARRRDL